MKLTIGGHSANALLDRLTSYGVGLNKYAAEYIDALRNHVTIPQQTLHIRFVTPAELDLPGGGSLSRIFAAAFSEGFDLCPPETALYLRLRLMDQPASADNALSAGRCPDGAITVASRWVINCDPMHRGLYLRNVDGRMWLRGYICDDEYIWPEESVFAFAVKVQE